MKWGIIGAGTIAHKFAVTVAGMKAEGDRVVAVASRSIASAQAFAAQYGIPRAYGSYEEMLNDAEVEAVYVATPNSFHYEHSALSLRHGKHVLCEKPFTLNAGQARELYALAREKGLFIMEAFWIRFLPVLTEMRRAIAAGEIGTVLHARSDYGYIPREEKKEVKRSFDLGVGAMMDIGIYNLGFVRMVMDAAPARIESTVRKNEYGTDEFSAVLLEYPGGRSATVLTGFAADMPRNASVFGTEGEITLPDFQMAEKMTVRRYDGNVREVAIPFDVNGFEYEIREVNRCVKLGLHTSDVLREDDTLTVLDTMDELRTSWGVTYPGETK